MPKSNQTQNDRYTGVITFKWILQQKTEPIEETFATKSLAIATIEPLLDDTVEKAYIVDNVTDKVVWSNSKVI